MKSATMRNSILLDYVDEGLKSLMNFEKKYDIFFELKFLRAMLKNDFLF